MKIKKHLPLIIFSGWMMSAFVYQEKPVKGPSSAGYKIDTLAENLVVPWQITFLPDNTMLFTERPGRVRIYRNGTLKPKPAFIIHDMPLHNKSGLLGMCIHPDFVNNQFIYIANNYLQDNKMRLRVRRYQFKNDTLLNPLTILENIPANQNHTGCRLVFGSDKELYITSGDADQPALAQDLKAYNGKILRVNDDGSIPKDNPFINNDTALKEIWTYGHRNTQGLAFEPGTGVLFNSEHGPTGGDEINIIKKGQNYGWPVIHHRDIKEGMQSPLIEYTPSAANLRPDQYGRIRSLVTGPDGYIYFSTSQIDPAEGSPRPQYDMILRMRPTGSRNTALSSQRLIVGKQTGKFLQRQSASIMFQQLCASCHGNNLQGIAGKAKNMLNRQFQYGADKQSIIKNITNGIIEKGMPSWNGAISKADIERIANYIMLKTKRITKRK